MFYFGTFIVLKIRYDDIIRKSFHPTTLQQLRLKTSFLIRISLSFNHGCLMSGEHNTATSPQDESKPVWCLRAELLQQSLRSLTDATIIYPMFDQSETAFSCGTNWRNARATTCVWELHATMNPSEGGCAKNLSMITG